MYGSRGANGVIVITTNRYTAGNLRIMYQGRFKYSKFHLLVYDNLMSASEKFELERVWSLESDLYKELYDEIESEYR